MTNFDFGFPFARCPSFPKGGHGDERILSVARTPSYRVVPAPSYASASSPALVQVCLVYRADRRAAPEVWFQALACGWHYLAPSFTCYFRLAVAHLGVRGWQGCYAPCGADPVARQWMRLYCPERLHANDRAAEAAEAGG